MGGLQDTLIPKKLDKIFHNELILGRMFGKHDPEGEIA